MNSNVIAHCIKGRDQLQIHVVTEITYIMDLVQLKISSDDQLEISDRDQLKIHAMLVITRME